MHVLLRLKDPSSPRPATLCTQDDIRMSLRMAHSIAELKSFDQLAIHFHIDKGDVLHNAFIVRTVPGFNS